MTGQVLRPGHSRGVQEGGDRPKALECPPDLPQGGIETTPMRGGTTSRTQNLDGSVILNQLG